MSYAVSVPRPLLLFFFFNDTATTEIYTLSLHDALPICASTSASDSVREISKAELSARTRLSRPTSRCTGSARIQRSEEHTSELQSQSNLVCRLLLEKKKKPHQSPTRALRIRAKRQLRTL